MIMERKTGRTSAALLAAVFLAGLLAGLGYKSFLQMQEPAPTGRYIPLPEIAGTPVPPSIESSVTIAAPAIDSNGNGTVMNITVQKRGGYGETLIDINDLVFWFDTQESIQAAKSVAEALTGVDTRSINLVYMIRSDASLVGGPSAGAALTIATIAALTERKINDSVMITGTIRPDGTIGQVGGIEEKARAAKDAGISLFLVPKGQGVETFPRPYETCRQAGRFTYCTTTYKEITVDVSQAVGIAVKEVSTIEDAERYFFGQ